MFAENNRISHRQLTRQIVLSLVAPFVLCLAGRGWVRGTGALWGLLVALVLLAFYIILLVRLGSPCDHLCKYLGKPQSILAVSVYAIYILFTAAYVLDLASFLAADRLLDGEGQWYVRLAIVVVCALGSHEGLQRRARIAEVSYWVVTGGLLLLLLLAFCQGQMSDWQELTHGEITVQAAASGGYEILCGFLPLALLPFALPCVARPSGSGRAVFGGVCVLGLITGAFVILMPMSLGWERMLAEDMPVLPFLTGVNLPGKIFDRFDVIWLSLLLYALLYSLGSLFYYENLVLRTVTARVNHWIPAAIVWLIACDPVPGLSVSQYYRTGVAWIGFPVLVLMTVYIYIRCRRRNA